MYDLPPVHANRTPKLVPVVVQVPRLTVELLSNPIFRFAQEEALTILVPLNGEESFQGGGTAFWSNERAQKAAFISDKVEKDRPDFVLVPPAGSAIVFAGCVTHAAVAVTGGERCILVASLSPASGEEPEEEAAAAS